jgi:hypothetical protein
MPSTLIDTARPAQRRARTFFAMALLVAAVGVALVGAHELVRGPRFVDRLTIRNPTPSIVDVSVTDVDGKARAPVAALEPHITTVVRSVIDPGDPWILDFRIAGERVGRMRVSRAQLDRNDWRIVVPENALEQVPRRAP